MQAMNRRSTFEKLFREDRTGETIQVIRKEMHLGAEKGKQEILFLRSISIFASILFREVFAIKTFCAALADRVE